MKSLFNAIWNFFSTSLGVALLAAFATQLVNFIVQIYFKNIDKRNALDLKNIDKRNTLEIKLFEKKINAYEKLSDNLYNLQAETIVNVTVKNQPKKLNVFIMFETYENLKQIIIVYRDHVITSGAFLDRLVYNKSVMLNNYLTSLQISFYDQMIKKKIYLIKDISIKNNVEYVLLAKEYSDCFRNDCNPLIQEISKSSRSMLQGGIIEDIIIQKDSSLDSEIVNYRAEMIEFWNNTLLKQKIDDQSLEKETI